MPSESQIFIFFHDSRGVEKNGIRFEKYNVRSRMSIAAWRTFQQYSDNYESDANIVTTISYLQCSKYILAGHMYGLT
jgi:hypothetical protein